MQLDGHTTRTRKGKTRRRGASEDDARRIREVGRAGPSIDFPVGAGILAAVSELDANTGSFGMI